MLKPQLNEVLKKKGQKQRELLRVAGPIIQAQSHPRNDLLPTLLVDQVAVEDLVLPKRAVRKSNAVHVQEVASAISTFGFNVPLVIGKSNAIIDGVTRLEAAKLLGMKTVPCVRLDHLTSTQQRLVRLAINRLGEKGEWNLEELKCEFEELVIEEEPLEVSGFSLDEIDHVLIDSTQTGIESGPLSPDPSIAPVAQIGDLFVLDDHLVLCGDARDPKLSAELMGSERARLVLTDIPFNVPVKGHVTRQAHREFAMASGELSDDEFVQFNEDWLKAIVPFLVDGGLLASFIDWRGQSALHSAMKTCSLEMINLIVWSKSNAGMGSLYRSAHELLPLYKSGDAPHLNNVNLGKNGRWRSNVWLYPGASSFGSDARRGLQDHPTTKPSIMLEDMMLDVTNRGDVILDPFAGSGSTMIAAQRCGRVCRSIELDPLYVDVMIRRWQAITAGKARCAKTGIAFDELLEWRHRERADLAIACNSEAKTETTSVGVSGSRPTEVASEQ